MKKNNYAFIDSQNLNLGILGQGWKLDFKRFRVHLKERYGVEKAMLFIGFVPGNTELYTSLQNAGYIVIFKPTLEYEKDGKKIIKGNVDAELVLYTMIEYSNFDKAVIVSGDGDFYCLIQYLDEKNKLLRLLIPNVYKYSKLLRAFAANKIDFMNNLKQRLEYKKREAIHKDQPLQTSSHRDVNIIS